MKKITLLALAVLVMVGCVEHYEETKINSDYSVRVIDSCEYIQYWTANYNMNIEHKGNCRFCEKRDSIEREKCKKELEELVIKLNEK